MGVLGTFLSFGWIGGNLVKEGIDNIKIEDSINKTLPKRILYKNGKYYDCVTGKQVMRYFGDDNVTNKRSVEKWLDIKTGEEIYIPSRDGFFESQKRIRNQIEELSNSMNCVWLDEAVENNLRYAKAVLPYNVGIKEVQLGYTDRHDTENGKYYLSKSTLCSKYSEMYGIVFKNGLWRSDGVWTGHYLEEKYE